MDTKFAYYFTSYITTWNVPKKACLYSPPHPQPEMLPPSSWSIIDGVLGGHVALIYHAATHLEHDTGDFIPSNVLALIPDVVANVFVWT